MVRSFCGISEPIGGGADAKVVSTISLTVALAPSKLIAQELKILHLSIKLRI